MKNTIRKLITNWLYSNPKISRAEKVLLSTIALAARIFLIDGSKRVSYLEYWQGKGVSILPNRYFEPIPEISEVRKLLAHGPLLIDDWSDTDFDRDVEGAISSVPEIANLKECFSTILNNKMFNGLDLIICEKIVQKFRPKRIIEIGAGYSTYAFLKFSDADCRITSIEPYPSSFLKDLATGQERITLIEQKIQDLPSFELFTELESGDILFIDSTHVCNVGGDLPVIFSKILPRLRPGVIVHVHDVALPYEYPESLVIGSGRLYNEQYLLSPLIAHGAYEPLFGSYRFLQKRSLWLVSETQNSFVTTGASLWLLKI